MVPNPELNARSYFSSTHCFRFAASQVGLASCTLEQDFETLERRYLKQRVIVFCPQDVVKEENSDLQELYRDFNHISIISNSHQI